MIRRRAVAVCGAGLLLWCTQIAVGTAGAATKVHNAARGGGIFSDEIWSGEILVERSVRVPKGVTLTILPGTTVKFKHYRGYKEPHRRVGVEVEGVLKAEGTARQQIRFTSDDFAPVNGDWTMLRFYGAQPGTILKYAIVEYAQQGINLWQCSPTISHCIVRWNNWEGIYLESYCKPLLEFNKIYENGYNGIAMEQFNEARIRYCIVSRSGTNGIHVDASVARIEGCIVRENGGSGISLDDHSTVTAVNNTIGKNKGAAIGFGEGTNRVVATGNQTSGNRMQEIHVPPGSTLEDVPGAGAGLIAFDYPEPRSYVLGYIPGDPLKDRFMYVYPAVDETRRVIRKIGKGLGLTWSVTWDGSHIWTSTLSGDVYKLDPVSGKILARWKAPGPQPWGMTWDGKSFWINDFAEKKVYEVDTAGKVLSSFEIPDKTGGAKGIAWDGKNLVILGWTSPQLYVVQKTGKLVETIPIRGGHAGGGLAWDGAHFWAPGGRGICKIDRRGRIVGGIYAASEGTWDLAWDGRTLWATQRTNENWPDAKIFQIEILDDSLNDTRARR